MAGSRQHDQVNSVGKTRSDKEGKQSVMKKARWALHCNRDWEPILTASILCVADLTDALVAEQEQKSLQPDSKIWREREREEAIEAADYCKEIFCFHI